MSESARAKISAARSKPQVKCICLNCGNTFETHQCEVKRGGGKFCCKKCEGESKKGIPILDEIRNKKISDAHKGKKFTDEHRANISKAMRGRPSPKKGIPKSEQQKEKQRQKMLGRRHTTEHNNKIRLSVSNVERTPHWKQAISEALSGQRHSYEHTMKNVESKLGGFWYGNVIYGYPKYCELFKDVKPRVRALQGDACCECGALPKTKQHPVHHVFYEKRACCDYNEDGIYYSNLNAKDHQRKDYCIGENPNYFVILCKKCHGKTNGSFENRVKWANHFKEFVDTKYNGKSYLSKEEYAAYKNSV